MKIFNDERINSVLNEYKYIIDNAVLRIDKLNEDIKNLENFLGKIPVPIEFELSVSDNEVLQYDKSKRIIYCLIDKDNQIIECKPLIECKAGIRLKFEDKLSSFLLSFIFALKGFS